MMSNFSTSLLLLLLANDALPQRGVSFLPYPKNKQLSFYWELKNLASFFNARKICRTEGGFLAILDDPDLWNWVYTQIEPQSVTRGKKWP